MARFPSTQWSLIRQSGGTPSVRYQAFGELATAYRDAILAFFRARLDASAAQDATQSFLAQSYEHGWWSRADAAAGSFRGFLLLLLRRHLGHMRTRMDGETEFDAEVVDPSPAADQHFDARFALALTARAVDVLRADYRKRDRGVLFDQLLAALGSPPEHGELQRIAAALGMPANTLTVELTRLRKRLREQVRTELKELCADQAALDSEWAILQRVLGGFD
jgi:DNA-directed RNA polymerase specialized sigma24 family protein